MKLIQVLFSNFLSFDFLVFVAAAADLALYVASSRMAHRLHGLMNLVIFVPEKNASKAAAASISALREADVVSLQSKVNRSYNFFTNMTGVFPLLGILGTVISLIPMVSDLSNIQLNFFAALTSTFWGLVFAILFKVMDGFLAPRMEDNDRSVALYLSRHQREEL